MTDRRLTRVRASALYDLFATTPLLLPWTQTLLHGALQQLHRALDAPGNLPALDLQAQLFAGLLAAVVTLWSLLRWRHPSLRLGRYDVVTRLLFLGLELWALHQGFSGLLWFYVLFEALFALLQAGCFRGEAGTLPARSLSAPAPRCPAASRS